MVAMHMPDHKEGHWLPAVSDDTLLGKDTRSAAPVPPPAEVLARFRFRSWDAQDLPQFCAMLNDPDLWRYMHEDYPGAMTPDLGQTLIDLSREARHHKVRAVEYDGQLVGQARMQWHTQTTPPGPEKSATGSRASIGGAGLRRRWSRSSSGAVSACSRHWPGLRRVYIGTMPRRIRSSRGLDSP